MMPIKDGIELCNELKHNELTSHIPIILLTAKVGEENEIQGLRTGADAYITKPFNSEKLKMRVEKLNAHVE
jgi:DNA-binding response OmpR family regulator